MISAYNEYNEVHPKLVRQLTGAGACDSEIQSVERSRPGCSLHQGYSLRNDAPARAAPGQKTGTRLCKPQHWLPAPNHTRQFHPLTARTRKRRNGHRLQGIFQGRRN